MIYLEFRRSGIEEPFLIRLDKIEGVTIQGIVVNGEPVFTVETYEEIIKKLEEVSDGSGDVFVHRIENEE